MAKEIGPFYSSNATLKVVIFNAAGQVRDVVGGAWVALVDAMFANCVVIATGTANVLYADRPAGLSASEAYAYLAYAPTAGNFNAPLLEMGLFGPPSANL